MWTALKPNRAIKTRETFATQRNKTLPRVAVLVIPEHAVTEQRVDISVDHDGLRLGFKFSPTGGFVCRRSNPKARAMHATIPVQFVDFIPLGTTEANVTYEGGMIVLDLTQFAGAAAAAAE